MIKHTHENTWLVGKYRGRYYHRDLLLLKVTQNKVTFICSYLEKSLQKVALSLYMIKHTYAKDLVTLSYFLVAPARGLKFLLYFLL